MLGAFMRHESYLGLAGLCPTPSRQLPCVMEATPESNSGLTGHASETILGASMRHESFSKPARARVDIILAAFMRHESDSKLLGYASETILATFMGHESYSSLAGRVSDTIPEAFMRHESWSGLAGHVSDNMAAFISRASV